MKCTICRECWLGMVADDGVTECRSNCPKCDLRLLRWMRSKTKEHKTYETAINADLWEEIQAQYYPYNVDGNRFTGECSDSKRVFAPNGEVRMEYEKMRSKERERFLEQKNLEEKENVDLLQAIKDPEIRSELNKQMEIEQRLKEERESLELAQRLQAEENNYSPSKLPIQKLHTRDEQVERDLEYALELSKSEKLNDKFKKRPNTLYLSSTSKKRKLVSPKHHTKKAKYEEVVDIRKYFEQSQSRGEYIK